jgi:hypothetical protein
MTSLRSFQTRTTSLIASPPTASILPFGGPRRASTSSRVIPGRIPSRPNASQPATPSSTNTPRKASQGRRDGFWIFRDHERSFSLLNKRSPNRQTTEKPIANVCDGCLIKSFGIGECSPVGDRSGTLGADLDITLILPLSDCWFFSVGFIVNGNGEVVNCILQTKISFPGRDDSRRNRSRPAQRIDSTRPIPSGRDTTPRSSCNSCGLQRLAEGRRRAYRQRANAPDFTAN